MDEANGVAGCDRLRLGGPEQSLVDEALPALEKGEADAEAGRPSGQGRLVERWLALVLADELLPAVDA